MIHAILHLIFPMSYFWLAGCHRLFPLVAAASYIASATSVLASPPDLERQAPVRESLITAQLLQKQTPHPRAKEKELLDRAEKLLNDYSGDTRKLYEAKDYIEQVLVANPRNALAYIDLASLALSFGFISSNHYDPRALKMAHVALDKAFKLNPRLYKAYMIAGFLAWVEDDLVTAKKMTARAAKIRPGAPGVDIRYAKIANSEYKPDEAITLLNKALTKPLSLSLKEAAYEQFVIAYKVKKEYKLVDHYHQAILAIDPSPWAKINYADFLGFSTGGGDPDNRDYDKAISYGESALKDMDFSMAHHILGELYFNRANDRYTQRDLNGAISDFRHSAQHYRANGDEENYKIVQTMMQELNLGSL
jgi:tetratricopeptide (TPR) repeat protein